MTSSVAAAAAQVVTYDGLPAAAGGAHALRVKNPADARGRVARFLDACTQAAGPQRWAFQVATGGDPDASDALRTVATERLGGPSRRAQTHTEWGVRDDDAVDELLAALAAAGPQTTRYGAPLAALTQSVAVHLLDPGSGEPWSDLDPETFGGFAVDGYGRLLGASGVRAAYGTSVSTLSLWLNLPADGRLVPAAQHLQEHLPVRLSSKHWRRWAPTRAGDGYRSTKVSSPLAAV